MTPTNPPLRTGCCIVGAGPAGVVLGWLLARGGVDVTLLERHQDFDRDFRGDTLHPGVLEILDSLGLADQILSLPHTRMETLSFHTPTGSLQVADLSRLKTKYPFVAMLAQSQFLGWMAQDATRFAGFRLIMGADVRELASENGSVRGVQYLDADKNPQRIEAPLTVAADGRSSRLRRAAGLKATGAAAEIDVLWFRIPRLPDQRGGGYLGAGGYAIVLRRGEEWQVGYVIPKGQHQTLRAAGIGSLRERLAGLAPELAPSLAGLDDWKRIRLLSVQADCLKKWYLPGLLFLGDAAHVMSPVGGVGINVAIQDAVQAANLLVEPLLAGKVSVADLRRLQRRRRWPVRVVQIMQSFDQRHLIEPALRTTGGYRLPLWLRLIARTPIVRHLPAKLMAFGVRRVRVDGRFQK